MEFQIKERQNISNHCFVCGIKNPIGLQAKMEKLLRFLSPMRCVKADHRSSRNYLRGFIGDEINLLLAASAFNFKKR